MPGRIRAVWPGTPIAPDPYKGIKIDTPVPKPTRRLVELALGSQSDADNNAPIPRLYGLHEIKSKPSQVRYGFQSFDTLYVVRVLALGQREATVFGAESSGQLDGVAAVYDERGRAASSFANFSYVFHNGALSQGVDTSLAGVDGSWNETLVITDKTGKLRGISYVVEIYQNVSKYWKTLPSWYYQVRGSRIANLLNSSTVEYTENLFNIWRDWAIDPEGMYLSPSQLSMTRFTAAATVGNQTLGAGKRYSAHLEIGGGDVKDWLKMFRLLGDAYWFEDEAGLWSVLVDRPTAPVATYTDLHYSGSKQTEMGPQSDADELKNAVSIEYTNTATLPWTKLKVELRDATVASNTEDEDPLEYQLPALHDRAIAQTKLPYILYSNIDDYRLPLNWRANTGDRVMGDVVTQTIAERGLTGEWRLITRERLPNNTSDVELLLMSARKYADTNTAAAAQVTSTLADPFATPPDVVVGTIGFTVELPQLQGGSRSPRGILTWTNPSNDPFHDHFELSISVNGGATRSLAGNIISPCQIGDLLEIGNYTFTLVNVSTLDLKSAGTSKTFAYAGKTTPPSDVPYVWIERRGEEVKVCWLPPPDPDIGQYIVERGLTTDTWSTAGIVAVVGGSTNYILDKPATSVGLPGGAWRYLVKACDTSKNISVNAKTADIVVFAQGSPPAEVSGFGPHFFVEFGNEPDVLRFGDAIYEGVYTNATRRAMLCRALSPATAQSEITSGSLASIQQWETLVDAPRRGGQPLWAPLDVVPVQVEISGMGAQYSGSFYRNTERRARLSKRVRVGREGSDIHSRCEPVLVTGITGDMIRTGATGPATGTELVCNLNLVSNNAFAQTMLIIDPNDQGIWYTEQKIGVPIDVVDIVTDGSGNASYTLPTAKQLPSSCTLLVLPSVLGSTNSDWTLSAVNNASFTVKVFNPSTGAGLSGLTARCAIRDEGLGGLITVAII